MYINDPGSYPSIYGLNIPPNLANTFAIPNTVPLKTVGNIYVVIKYTKLKVQADPNLPINTQI